MMDEHFMRAWNEGHARLGADVAQLAHWLATPFRRMGDYIHPTSIAGTDSVFVRAVARRGASRTRSTR